MTGTLHTPSTAPGKTVRASRVPVALRSLRHTSFSLFWFAQIISTTGTWMQGMALSWLVFKLTGSPLYLGLVATAGTLPTLVLSLPSGVLADRFSKRRIVIVTQALAMFHAAVLAALAYTGMIEVWHILVLALFIGAVNAVDIPTRQSMVIELVGREDLLNAVSLNSAVFNVTRLIGPALAGVVVAGYGAAACFTINCVSYLAAIAALLLMRCQPPSAESKAGSMLQQTKQGLDYIVGDRVVRDLLILTGVASVFVLQYGTQIPAFALEVFDVGAKGQGILMSAAGLGALMAAAVVAAFGHRCHQGTMVLAGALVIPAGLIAFSLAPSYHIAAACLVVAGFGVMSFLAVSNSIIQAASPDALRGRVVSVRAFVSMGFAPLGALLVGFIAEYAGIRQSVLAGGVVFLFAAVHFAARSRSIRRAH